MLTLKLLIDMRIFSLKAPSLILILGLLLSSCAGCDEDPLQNKLLVFLDMTDPTMFHQVRDDASEALKKLSKSFFRVVEYEGGSLRIVRVRDNCQNKPLFSSSYAPLPAGVSPFGVLPNDYQLFLKSMKQFQLDSAASGYTKTCLYEPLCNELIELTKTVFPKKGKIELLIYSDMLENNGKDSTSLYKNKSLDSETFEARLVRQYKLELPSLEGVKIHIINHRNVKNDDLIRYSGLLWKEMFERHGATVVGPKADF
jgi:hypothetical protein